MTEDEAKTKWCPFVRVGMYGSNSTSAQNRGISTAVPDTVTCIGSRCAVWVVLQPEMDITQEHFAYRPKGEVNPPFSNCPEGFTVTGQGSHDHYIARKKTGTSPAQGMCGMAR